MSLYPALWAESWTPYRQHFTNLEAFHICCLQKILNLSWEEQIPHTVILSNTDSICIEAAVVKKHLRWLGQTIRTPEHRLPRQVLYSQLMGAKHSAGGQKQRFKDYTRERTFPSRSSNLGHSTGQSGRSPVPLQSLKYTKPTKIDDLRDASRDTSGWLVHPWYLVSLAPSAEECVCVCVCVCVSHPCSE